MRGVRSQKSIGTAGLDYAAGIQHDNLVIVENCFKLVGNGEDCVVAEPFPDNSLHDLVGYGIDTKSDMSVFDTNYII